MSTEAPKRIQLRRTKGWRKPEGAIVVARPSRWGNPFRIVPGFGDIEDFYEIGADDPCPSLPATERRRIVAQNAVDHYRGWMGDGFVVAIGIGKGPRWTNRRVGPPSFSVDLDSLGTDGHVRMHRAPDALRSAVAELRGHDLACWCSPDQPCHADVLLELANGPAA